ncbi:MAG TPA: Trm112 family protein [Hyphomicrobiaceae bacterium]|nr:Trm112 family protein [Hyphomicrobiaceae bacterium]
MSEESKTSETHAVDRRLLEILVCPLTKTSLDYDPVRGELISRAARLAFPIRDGVPLMSVDAARRLDEEEGEGPAAAG